MKQDRPTRIAYYAWELPEEWLRALMAADYSHLPEMKRRDGKQPKIDSNK